MSQNVHITHINDTTANLRSDMDEWQYGNITDNSDPGAGSAQDDCFSFKNASATRLYAVPSNKWIDPSTGTATYLSAEFDSVYVRANVYLDDAIIGYGDTDTKIDFTTDDAMSLYCGNVLFLYMSEDDAQKNIKWNSGNVDIDYCIGSVISDYSFQLFGDTGLIELQDASLAHGVTTVLSTQAYGRIKKFNSTYGGLELVGAADGAYTGVNIKAISTGGNTGDNYCKITAYKANGTGVTDVDNADYALQVQNNGAALLNVLGSGNVSNTGSLTVGSIAHETTDVDTFIVSNAGLLKYRTGAEVLSDIGGAAALSGTQNYIAKFTSATAIGDSRISDTGSGDITITSDIALTGSNRLISLSYSGSVGGFLQGLDTGGLRIYDGTENSTYFNNGKIGIGIPAPLNKLSILDTSATVDTVLIQSDSTTTATLLRVYANNGNATHSGSLVEIVNDFNATGTADLLYLQQDDDGDGLVIDMARNGTGLIIDGVGVGYSAIFNNGNVGIGVVDPDTMLEVMYAGNQLKLSYDGTDNCVFAVDTNGNITYTLNGNAYYHASSTANSDIVMGFLGTSNSGEFWWMEDEAYFEFKDDILMYADENIYLRDTAISIASANDGHLDLTADTSIDINGNTYVSGTLGVGTTSADRKFHVEVEDAVTDAVTYVSRFSHMTSGTAADTLMVGVEFEAETSYGTDVYASITAGSSLTGSNLGMLNFMVETAASTLSTILSVKPTSLEIGCGAAGVDYGITFIGESNYGSIKWMEDENYFKFEDDICMDAGQHLIFDTGAGTKIGTATNQLFAFWNASPVAQQVLATGAGASVDNVISLLQTLGLCRQS